MAYTYDELRDLYEERMGDGEYFTDFLMGEYGSDEEEGFKFITQEGGGEGGGEHCESVINVDGKFYKITYSYQSYNGFDFDYAEVTEVSPKQKTITVYE